MDTKRSLKKNKPLSVEPVDTIEDGAALAASNSLARTLGILNLFTPAAPLWSTEAIIQSHGMSRSSGYRYIKALADVGLIAPVSNGYYILGPRIVELDRQIRQCDPLYIAGGPVMKELVTETKHSAHLCALFSGAVLCVRERLTDDSPANLFTRGQTRPLFQGAASKIILPYLRPHQLRSLHAKHASAIAAAGLGSDWSAFRATLAKIRTAGYTMTVGEFNPGVIGISAPVFNSEGHILGSIGIAGAESHFTRAEKDRCVTAVIQAGEQISERIGAISVGIDRPARAVG
ncbi:DNA-binding IclR family transcriptional regulator [Burkholderia sp. OAS925]|uniref:IclR family transcriptional regulator n=1 Tax=Paraburkholderia TaxID=1822464 RepID=UPI00178937C6|nr:IclR family transcriptional regulator [Paraburkholderia graminis]MDR6478850.1 DNA-binding IclR family transcriptional regulator [Paraburkholderia graminis]